MMYDQLYTISLAFFGISVAVYVMAAFRLSQDIHAGRIPTRLDLPTPTKKAQKT